MGIAKVGIKISPGNILKLGATQDNVMGIIIAKDFSSTAATHIKINEPRLIHSLDDVAAAGITEKNTEIYTQLNDFFKEAGTAPLWIMIVETKIIMSEMAKYAKTLVEASQGAINVLGLCRAVTTIPTIKAALDADVGAAVTAAQGFAEQMAKENYPLRVVVSGRHFSGTATALINNTGNTSNRVGVVIGATDTTKEACIGLVLGRLAKIGVQENLGKVKTGKLNVAQGYFTDGNVVETKISEFDVIDDRKYIFLRTFGNHKVGYYFNNDYTCASETEPYSSLSAGRVIDKAHRIAYATFLNHLLDNVEVNADGSLPQYVASAFEAEIEGQITGQMVVHGELSDVKADIDTKQEVLTTSTLNIVLKLVPVGTLKNIVVDLSFSTL